MSDSQDASLFEQVVNVHEDLLMYTYMYTSFIDALEHKTKELKEKGVEVNELLHMLYSRKQRIRPIDFIIFLLYYMVLIVSAVVLQYFYAYNTYNIKQNNNYNANISGYI